jgi:hypothetical protein
MKKNTESSLESLRKEFEDSQEFQKKSEEITSLLERLLCKEDATEIGESIFDLLSITDRHFYTKGIEDGTKFVS